MPDLKVRHCLAIAAVTVVIALVHSIVLASGDILSIAEKKGPIAKDVVAKPTITRVSNLHHLPVSLEQYEFLIDRPHLSMVLARVLEPSLDPYKVELRPNGLIHVHESSHLAGDLEVIDSIRGRRVYFISGHMELLKIRINGHMVVTTVYSENVDASGVSVNSQTTGYIKLKSVFFGGVAKVMSSLFPKKADERIKRFAKAVRTVAAALHDDPEGAYRKLASSGEVSAAELKEFAQIFLKKQ